MAIPTEHQQTTFWQCAMLMAALWLAADAATAHGQNVPVTIKGTLFVQGFRTKVKCEAAAGNTLSAGPTARYLVVVPSCLLSRDAEANSSAFRFDGKEEQLRVGDPSNPVTVSAVAFSGAMYTVVVGDSVTHGVLHGVAKGTPSPVSERGEVAYVRELFDESGSRFVSFVGEYKAKY